jgi:peptidoglycan/xylan/chitin deacetylase (PgdA/CDA1 family)
MLADQSQRQAGVITGQQFYSPGHIVLKIICPFLLLLFSFQLEARELERRSCLLPVQQAASLPDEISQSQKATFTIEEGAILRGPLKEKRLALVLTADTYGEGLPSVLSALEERQIKASFFLTGNFLRQPEFTPLVKRMIEEGHYVGAHSDRHLLYCDWNLRQKTLVSRSEFLSDLENNYAELARFGLDKNTSPYFLPPYEWYNQEIADWTREAGLVLINFTPGTSSNADYTTPADPNYLSSEEIYRRIISYEKSNPSGLNGFILLIHPGTAPARTDKFYNRLGQLLDELTGLGYSWVRIDQLLTATGEQQASSAMGKVSTSETFIPSLSTVWSVESPGKITGLGCLGELIFWATEQEQVFLAEAQSGEIKNSLDLKVNLVQPPAAGSRGLWLAAGSDLWLIDEKGQVARKMSELPDLIYPRVEQDGQLYLIAKSKQEARQPVTGEIIWQSSLSLDSSVSPVWSNFSLFCVSVTGQILKIDKKTGRVLDEYQPEEKISVLLSRPEEKALFIGTVSGSLLKYNLSKKKASWAVKLGSQKVDELLLGGKYLYVLTSGAILYKLRAGEGDLAGWQPVPARLFGRPLIFSDALIVPALENLLFVFELKAVQNSSRTVLPADLAVDLALKPASRQAGSKDLLLAGLYNEQDNRSLVVALTREPQLFIEASPLSPQPPGQRIVLTVRASGFSRPKYEFYLRSADGQEKLKRKASVSNSWSWFPVKEGEYTIVVKVSDKKLTRKAELSYNITRILNRQK